MPEHKCDPSMLAEKLKELARLGERVVYVRPSWDDSDQMAITTAFIDQIETR